MKIIKKEENQQIPMAKMGYVKDGGTTKTYIRRSPSDWMSDPLEQNTEKLASLAADYYGDKMLINITQLDNMK